MHITPFNLNGRTCLLTKGPEGALALVLLFPDFDPDPASSWVWINQSKELPFPSPLSLSNIIPIDFETHQLFPICLLVVWLYICYNFGSCRKLVPLGCKDWKQANQTRAGQCSLILEIKCFNIKNYVKVEQLQEEISSGVSFMAVNLFQCSKHVSHWVLRMDAYCPFTSHNCLQLKLLTEEVLGWLMSQELDCKLWTEDTCFQWVVQPSGGQEWRLREWDVRRRNADAISQSHRVPAQGVAARTGLKWTPR